LPRIPAPLIQDEYFAGLRVGSAVFACFTTGRWEITASNGALYWPALLKGVGARTSPRLAWPAIVSGKAVAWWAGL
jgi:hypothetical protein